MRTTRKSPRSDSDSPPLEAFKGPICPKCGSETAVPESRKGDGDPVLTWRLRRCKNNECREAYTTAEMVVGRYLPANTRPSYRFGKKGSKK